MFTAGLKTSIIWSRITISNLRQTLTKPVQVCKNLPHIDLVAKLKKSTDSKHKADSDLFSAWKQVYTRLTLLGPGLPLMTMYTS